jgi:hypothetical protein
MREKLTLVLTALVFTIFGFVGGLVLSGARAEGGDGGSNAIVPAELLRRIEALEASLAEVGSVQSQTSDRELARIADEVHDASDRWLRDISGNLVQISRELENIRRAIEAK